MVLGKKHGTSYLPCTISHILFCFQLPDHTVNDRNSLIRCVIDIRVHICQEILKDLKDKRLSDCKAHMLSGICLIGKRTRISTKIPQCL